MGLIPVPLGSQQAVLALAAALGALAAALAAAMVWQGRRSRRSLHRLRSDYETLLDTTGDAVYTADLSGRICSVNRAAERLTGYGREELLGMRLEELLAPETRDALRNCLERIRAEGEAAAVELIIVRKDGDQRAVECSARLSGGTGEAAEVVGIVRDITDRRQAEEVLGASPERWLQLQRLEALGRLAGGIAHDFNNLLTVVQGYANLALDRLEADHPAREDLEEIPAVARRAASLTRQLLAFSRRQVLYPAVINLNELIADMKQMLERLIGEDIELVTVLDPDLGPVHADPAQIEQVILNLVVNARDAMPEGGRLTIGTANLRLEGENPARRSEVPPGDYVLLWVSDTGCGIPSEIQPRIFDPFFTTKAEAQGTGLGLSTVYGIVTQSGGHITVTSEPGAGATFRIYLPRWQEEAVAAPAPARVESAEGGPAPVGGSETILLVEDDDAVRALASRTLEQLGYRVIEAAHPEEALERAASAGGRVDLLISDVILPGMTGVKLARRLRDEHSGMRVLFLSGYPAAELADRQALEPAAPLLPKPFTPQQLARSVREVLETQA